MSRIPVTVLTGFLGAGKTTVLNRLLAEPGLERTAVIVNEFGETGIDGGLVAEADARAFAMSTGCLCCTVSGDVRLTLLRLLDEAERGVGPAFDRVIVETTGLADPAPVLQTFMTNDMILDLFALNGVVTVVDCILGDGALDRFEEARRQAGVADVLLLSKTDMARDPASLREVAALGARLAALNPNARVMEAGEATAETVLSLAAFDPAGRPPDVAAWLRFGEAEGQEGGHHHHGHDHDGHDHDGHDHHGHGHHGHGHHHHDVNRHGDAVSAFCYGATAPLDPGALEDAIGALRASLGRDLLRLKGIVALAGHEDRPAVVHAVGHIANPPRLLPGWPSGIGDTRLVVIAAGPGRDAVDGLLTRFLPDLVRSGG